MENQYCFNFQAWKGLKDCNTFKVFIPKHYAYFSGIFLTRAWLHQGDLDLDFK